MKRNLFIWTNLTLLIILFCSCARNVSSDNSSPEIVKKTFIDFFHFEPGSDVANFHFYADELGIDASYWIAFNCNDTTVQKIRKVLRLDEEKQTQGLFGGLNSNPKEWWDTSFIFKATAYTKNKDQIYWFLWYDKTHRKAYFLTLDV